MHVPALVGFTLVSSRGLLAASIWFLAVLPASLAGLGLIARRILRLESVLPELLPALGLATYVFAGGILNLLRLAHPLAIWLLLVAGLIAFCRAVWLRRTQPASVEAGTFILGLLALGLVAFTAATQALPSSYNWNDDLQSYFAHPVRMLQTGTVYGSPLSSVGAVSLGGMAFVQCAALVCLPLSAINGSDAVLGLVLCLVPLVAYGARHPRVRPVVAVAIVALLAIDPFYVNVSALYLGSALMIAAVLLTNPAGDDALAARSPLAIGAVYAALVALKPTFLLFVALHAACVFAGSAFSGRNFRAALAWLASACAVAAILLAPWILVHLHHYLSMGTPSGSREMAHQAVSLAGTLPLANGFTGLGAYSLLVIAMAALVAAAIVLGPAPRRSFATLVGVSAALVGIAAYPLMLFVFPRVVGYADADPDAVRYYIPVAIGVFPIALCVASRRILEGDTRLSPRERLGLCLFLGVFALAGFSGSAAVRFRDAAKYHTLLPYPAAHDPILASAMQRALGADKQAQVQALQDKIPEGASLVAWIYTPYFLDYSRNRIYDAELAGISNRWAEIPKADYYLWEYRGSADLKTRVQRIIDNLPAMDGFRIAPLREFERRLSEAELSGRVVVRDGEYLLVGLGPGATSLTH